MGQCVTTIEKKQLVFKVNWSPGVCHERINPNVTNIFNIHLIYLIKIRILDEREEPGFLTGLKIPAPWAAGKNVETVHPVRDNYKFKETVHIPGARCLYLRFDSRCSSQYDYDKVK